MWRRLGRALATLALLTGALGVALVVAEVVVRRLDGYPLLPLRLPPFSMAMLANALGLPASLAPQAAALTTAPDVDPAWIDDPPPSIRGEVDPELLARRALLRHPQVGEYELYNVWNARYVEEEACTTFNILPLLPTPIQVYDPPEPSRHPPFRFPPGRTTPAGLTTNRFGFRGPDIPLDKPPRTVRVAFAGASTTVGNYTYPFSYPECVVHWLNRWAAHARQDVHFDLVNAGRPGISSTDIAAIVRTEVLPLEPDLIVYYEGANQFIFTDHLAEGEAGIDASRWAKGLPPATWGRLIAGPRQYSALARRLDDLAQVAAAAGGREPPKPPYRLRWPARLDETAPDVARPDLPLGLPVILRDLESIRTAADGAGAELVVSSFVWLASDGLRLDPVQKSVVYQFLNERCWPYRYADIRRFADFQNRVFRRWADEHQLPFVDVAGVYPPRPELFYDAIHFNEDGTRLQAWIVLNGLLPHIRERFAAGAWPRPDRDPLIEHPGLGPARAYSVPCAQ